MSNKKEEKKENDNVKKQISSLKKTLKDYKAERKANWKTFKNKMKDDICKIKKQ